MKTPFRFIMVLTLISCIFLTACGSQTATSDEKYNTDETESPTYKGVLLDEAKIPEDGTEFAFKEDMKLAEFNSVDDSLSLSMKIYNNDHQQIDINVELFGIEAVPEFSEQASAWLTDSLSSAHEIWLEWPYEQTPDWENEDYLWCNVWSDDLLVQDVLLENGWAEVWPS